MEIRITPIEQVAKDYPWKTESWIASAVRNPNQVDAMFSDLGLGSTRITRDLDDAIGGVVRRYPDDFAPFGKHRPASGVAMASMAQAIMNWLEGIEVVEEDTILITKQIPLCLFNSPDVPGAKTTYGETVTQEGDLGWKIEVLGTGFGADVTVAVKNTSEFVSSSGDQKLVFAPLNMRVVKASLYKHGVFQKSFLKAELAETEVRDANGLRSVSVAEWQEFTSGARVLDHFDLSGDTSSNNTKYSRSYKMTGSFESKLGLKISDLEASVVAKCIAEYSADVTFELPPGRMYELWVSTSISGFFFSRHRS